MMYVIFKQDGSLDKVNLDEFIQQGNDGVNTIFVAVDGLPEGYVISASMSILLPNQTTTTILSVSATRSIEGFTYTGFDFTLTSAETNIAGIIKPTIQITHPITVLYTTTYQTLITYPFQLTINATGVRDDSEINITNARFRTMLGVLASKQDAFMSSNVRGYTVEEEYETSYPNLVQEQIILVYNYDKSELMPFIKYEDVLQDIDIANAVRSKYALRDNDGNNIVNTYANKLTTQTISGTWTFSTLPLTQAVRVYNNDRQLADKEYADDRDEYYYGVLDAKIDLVASEHTTINNKITAIENKIPSQATSSNKLADKDWVNSTINSLAAFYITYNIGGDPFPKKSDLDNATTFYSGGEVRVPTRNDYCLVNADETHDNKACRYIFQGVYGQGGSWQFQFVVNDTPFTQAQLNAINSGITDVLVAQITTNQNNITTLGSNKLDKTEAQTTYQPRIEYKDISVLSTEWTDGTCVKATGITGLGENDILEFMGSTFTDDGYIGAFRIKMTAFDNTTGNLTMTALNEPTENILIRITITKNTKLLGE